MPVERTKAKVAVNKLAFWETAIELESEPSKYLKFGEKITVIGNVVTHGGIFADKEYYKVEHPIYGNGYVRKEGITTL